MPNFNLTDPSGLKIICGHVGKEPVERFTQSGKKVVSFTVATNRKDASGNVTTDWHSIQAWEQQADEAMRLHKGQVAFVIGPAKTREYNGKEYVDISAWAIGIGFPPPQRAGQHEQLPQQGAAEESAVPF